MIQLPRRALWEVGLWAVVLPALALLLLVRRAALEIEPSTASATAVLVGAGTLVLPFSTMLFSHVTAAALSFAAFTVLFVDRGRLAPALAGLLAGLAIVVDYPLALTAAALAAYAAATAPRIRRVGIYAAGTIAGVLPLAAFNVWAFRSIGHVAYANAVLVPGRSGHDVLGANGSGFFGLGVPSVRAAVELLVSAKGLLTVAPVLALGCAGAVVLYRRGLRAEALLIAALAIAYLVYDAGYYLPFGGWVPGPRFLIPIVPFLGLPLAVALRRWPLTTLALALVSIGAMTLATAAEPLIPGDDTASWLRRARHGDFTHTALTFAGAGHGWLAISPFLLAVATAFALAVVSIWPLEVTAADLVRAPAAVVAWLIVLLAVPSLLRTDRAVGQAWGAAATVLACALLVVTVARLGSAGPAALLVAAPLLLLLVPAVHEHTKWALALALLGTAVLAWRYRRHTAPAPGRRART